ncbi:DUF4345 domain-containing protein [Streptomyces sp. NBC_01142]|uniref:DUF4345 domain-containing protein n=1 Tax=Streptomyces sp. NBC_01142 TaxID=2975865 RepID=UPI002254B260|nr:DUF4345 domain-containing protein [Streptomyces sp. NBC_01142]MCX4824564.1 DUF4345 domain-containing protein [Streptomyces sp. NBC_01142]
MPSRRMFQGVLTLLGVILMGTGTPDIIVGVAALPGSPDASTTVDSNYRFFAGVWFTLGIVLLAAVRRPESHGLALRGIFGAVFVGGVARGVSYLAVGAPHVMHTAFIGVELLLPPLLLLWYGRLTRTAVPAVTP